MPKQRKAQPPRRSTPPAAANRQDAVSRIARRARELREERGLLLHEAAERMGVSNSTISEIESGSRWRSVWDSVLRLAQAYGCEPADFFGDTEDKR
jgi:transcriptional regulator with XRE-family HTH domain